MIRIVIRIRYHLCSGHIPRMFMFDILNLEEFSKQNPEFETFDRFVSFPGKYELYGFGRYEGCQLKMGSIIDGLHQLTPIWRNIYTGKDSHYFIFFNHTRSRWELHAKRIHNGFCSSITYAHISCKTGSIVASAFICMIVASAFGQFCPRLR